MVLRRQHERAGRLGRLLRGRILVEDERLAAARKLLQEAGPAMSFVLTRADRSADDVSED